ncbi:fluoride efflux transporter CrcB [Alphaproteobacteria bacterium GH1-50]|uniref:Fluoride-specific ion channel FluC n=1 Tax=Kangsaoukella pontilimi TaxID=2691042 RepID=A0A7C9M7V5_9RHOB|nr:fluoride efflux transporter CrcB [Kangsaoukella pontilimi]MXQ06253.1 fluoride efflux transporter CrcB [Kangsaoukella pontilimi]
MIGPFISVAIGGALGATLRYAAGLGIVRAFGHTSFPTAIITVNVLGSFLMGLFVVLAAHRGWTHLSPLVMTGLLGGFTTFSAFSLEAVTLYERGAIGQAAAYVGLSVVLSISALVAGVCLGRGLVT